MARDPGKIPVTIQLDLEKVGKLDTYRRKNLSTRPVAILEILDLYFAQEKIKTAPDLAGRLKGVGVRAPRRAPAKTDPPHHK